MNSRKHWRPWIWLCPLVMVGLAVAILFVVGLSIWTSLLAATPVAAYDRDPVWCFSASRRLPGFFLWEEHKAHLLDAHVCSFGAA